MTEAQFSPERLADLEAKRILIDQKLERGEALTPPELWMMGDQMQLDVLPVHSQCEDMYFRRLFLYYNRGEGSPLPPLTPEHIDNFQVLVQDWLRILQDNFPNDPLSAASQKETRLEFTELEKKWEANPEIPEAEKDEDLFWLLAWSRFRHVLVRRMFDLSVQGEYFSLYLNGKEIRFDMESAMHILARHFGQGMKVFLSVKDHFYGVFRHDRLHEDFDSIFKMIEASGIYTNDNVADVTIRFEGVIYKIWSTPLDNDVFRISTFFPVSSQKILRKLEQEYREVKVSDVLSVFIKAQNPAR